MFCMNRYLQVTGKKEVKCFLLGSNSMSMYNRSHQVMFMNLQPGC